MKFTTKEYWDRILCKLVDTLLSVKVWVIFLTFGFSIWLTSLIVEAKAWSALSVVGTVMTGIIATTVMMREGFKISRLNSKLNPKNTPTLPSITQTPQIIQTNVSAQAAENTPLEDDERDFT